MKDTPDQTEEPDPFYEQWLNDQESQMVKELDTHMKRFFKQVFGGKENE